MVKFQKGSSALFVTFALISLHRIRSTNTIISFIRTERNVGFSELNVLLCFIFKLYELQREESWGKAEVGQCKIGISYFSALR